jgi:hypothetical protein
MDIHTHPSAAVLGAYLDVILAGVPVYDADDIAKVVEKRPIPSYEERMAVFSPTGRLAIDGVVSQGSLNASLTCPKGRANLSRLPCGPWA